MSLTHDTNQTGLIKQQNVKVAKKKAHKIALATLLVDRGLFKTYSEAQRWVMAGKVVVNNYTFTKPGMAVPVDAILSVRGRLRYASRGGYKLEVALHYFGLNIQGSVVLDGGASTGGFTDCLLQHGAKFVYAVDVGFGQLAGRLRIHPQVQNLEKTNLGDEILKTLEPRPNLITLDLSYLSLTTALPITADLLATNGRVLALVKPLYEVNSVDARRTGKINDMHLLVDALEQIVSTGRACGLAVDGVMKLALRPRHGVHEFFVSFVRSDEVGTKSYDRQTLLARVENQGFGRTVIEEV